MSGTLYIVATPIGNLEDITLRALNTLKTVDLIACEDTRQTLKLLRHYSISDKPLLAYHNFNERTATERIIAELLQGKSVALVSDAGTPAISDPGFFLVRAAHERGLRVVPIAGISALTAALSVSPIPIRYFHFEGFLPQKKGRQTRLKYLASLGSTIVFYESPHRILKLLDELQEHFGNPTVMIARELTKLHEEILLGSPQELKAKFESKKILGEFVVIVHSELASDRESPSEDFSENNPTNTDADF
ncbi:MAG: 16S rRNA (cytidine(1402)-2'-O)-methyltransferase [Chloroherpetonaceae bacterium]